MTTIWLSIISCLFVIFPATSGAAETMPDQVFVSILPQKFFVEQIGGDTVDVQVMVQPGANPATYEPKPSQMVMLASSSAYFAIGVPFENVWLDKISGTNPAIKIIHTDEGIDKIAMDTSHKHEDDTGGEHKQRHNLARKAQDPHIWLSPTLVKKQAAIIYSALVDLFPDKSSLFQTNYTRFTAELEALHHELQDLLKEHRGKRFMVFHPSWGYFAREYGLEQIAIEIEGKTPKPAQLAELIEYAREHEIKVVFAQQQFSQKSASIIAREIDGEVRVVDPLAENWVANMKKAAHTFSVAVQ
ncbi:zinc ABC transporter substrate-binding protein [Desulfopila inferna]|nr:zinc ABC transporter substrate-binding protein [Desulfopila inferna]